VYYEDKVMPEEQRSVLCRRDWDVVTGCSFHDAGGGLRWGSEVFLDDVKKDLEDLYIVFASVRQSWNTISSWAPYIGESLLTVTDDDRFTGHDAYAFWTACGAEPMIAEDMRTVGIFLMGERIHANTSLTSKPNWRDWLVGRLLALWSLGMFTDSRPLTLGQCARAMVGALASGLGLLMRHLIGAEGVPKYYLKGWRRFTPRLRRHGS